MRGQGRIAVIAEALLSYRVSSTSVRLSAVACMRIDRLAVGRLMPGMGITGRLSRRHRLWCAATHRSVLGRAACAWRGCRPSGLRRVGDALVLGLRGAMTLD